MCFLIKKHNINYYLHLILTTFIIQYYTSTHSLHSWASSWIITSQSTISSHSTQELISSDHLTHLSHVRWLVREWITFRTSHTLTSPHLISFSRSMLHLNIQVPQFWPTKSIHSLFIYTLVSSVLSCFRSLSDAVDRPFDLRPLSHICLFHHFLLPHSIITSFHSQTLLRLQIILLSNHKPLPHSLHRCHFLSFSLPFTSCTLTMCGPEIPPHTSTHSTATTFASISTVQVRVQLLAQLPLFITYLQNHSTSSHHFRFLQQHIQVSYTDVPSLLQS